MRLRLLDQILEIEPGFRIVAVKQLRGDEEYLQDHFPRFPVMPGVLMLEAMFQASMWLVRETEQFAHAAVTLKEARNVKYADFVEPGRQLRVEAELVKQDTQTSTLKAQGSSENGVAVSGRLILERFHLAERYPELAPVDPYTRREMRREFEQLTSPCQHGGDS